MSHAGEMEKARAARFAPPVSTAPGVCGGCLCGHSPAARSHVEAVQVSSMDDGTCNGLGLIHGRSVIQLLMPKVGIV
jgi:hypothetical protein